MSSLALDSNEFSAVFIRFFSRAITPFVKNILFFVDQFEENMELPEESNKVP